MTRPDHILIIRLSAMGDVAMTVPVLSVLRKTYPQLQLTLLSRPFFKPLFRDIPDLGFLEADVYGKHRNTGLIKLAKEARDLEIDAVADLHNVIRSKLITGYLKIKGIRSAVIDKGRAEKKALTAHDEHKKISPLKTTHSRYADVFETLGYPVDLENYSPPERRKLLPKLTALIGVEPKKIIGIAPFAAHPGKEYPLSRIKEVIARLDAGSKYRILLFGGGKKETALLKQLARSFENVSSAAGEFSFEEELIVISNLDLMVSMDSGNGHLAANFGIPVLTLFGVTHPFAGFAPFRQKESQQLIADRKQFPLIPTSVYGNRYPKGYEKAMDTIDPQDVVSKIESMLS